MKLNNNDPLIQLIASPEEIANLKIYRWREHPQRYPGGLRSPTCMVPGCRELNTTAHRRCLKHFKEYLAERARLNARKRSTEVTKLKEELRRVYAKADQYKLEKYTLIAKLQNITCIIEGKPLIWTNKQPLQREQEGK